MQYPRIEADSRVTFRLVAPNAQKVQVAIVNVVFDMVKGDDGAWTYTSELQAPGYHNYWMLLDGAIVLDLGTSEFVGYGHMCNGFEVDWIDSNFRTLADKDHRAMAGLSMGGAITSQITLANLDKFANIGLVSGTMNGLSTEALDPATAFNGMFKDGEALNKRIKLLWIGMGTAEPNPFPCAIGSFRAMLDKGGIRYIYHESPGTAHEWLT